MKPRTLLTATLALVTLVLSADFCEARGRNNRRKNNRKRRVAEHTGVTIPIGKDTVKGNNQLRPAGNANFKSRENQATKWQYVSAPPSDWLYERKALIDAENQRLAAEQAKNDAEMERTETGESRWLTNQP